MRYLPIAFIIAIGGCKDKPDPIVPLIPEKAVNNLLCDVMTDQAMFRLICLQESGGKAEAFNESENAVGPAQIRPCFLQDANEQLAKEGKRTYRHHEMYSFVAAYDVVRAYWRRYGLKTLEQRARAHCGGPDGPRQQCTLPYWNSLKKKI